MASNRLLPPNTTALQRAAAEVCAFDLPVGLRELWNPDTCPESLLPWLAWSRSVDRWDTAWPVAVKRAVIKNAWAIHLRKGTVSALRAVIEPFGYVFHLVEWWQEDPPGPPGTFRIDLSVLDKGITDELYDQMSRLIADAKPLSRHMSSISIGLESRGGAHIGAVTYLGEELTIYPWTPAELNISAMASFSGADHTIDTMSVYP